MKIIVCYKPPEAQGGRFSECNNVNQNKRPIDALFACMRIRIVVLLLAMALPGVVVSQTSKTLFNYFQSTPIVCSPLSSNTWGASGVLPRDICNGVEAATKTPQWYYWDGKIIKAKDGKYHMFGARWAHSSGFGNWGNSDAFHAVSDSSPLGPYIDKGFVYDNGPDQKDRHKGHNVSAVELLDGTYAVLVSEIVPFTIFTSKSLDGPWTNLGHAQINTNGVTIAIPQPGDQHLESNVSLVVRPDGNYEIIQRHGIIAISTTGLLGPYNVQKPTNKYPANQQPGNPASIFPKRQKHTSDDPQAPGNIEETDVWAEDPLIWYGGGQYHVVYSYPLTRVGYHLTSPDGIHDWTDKGFAWDPRLAKQLFSNTNGTVANWFNMERPSVLIENGHVTYFTFAVADVDKGSSQISEAGHSSKVIVVAFDGKLFDQETGSGVGVEHGSGSGKSAIDKSFFVKDGSLRYSVAYSSQVIIKIFNLQGGVIATPVNSMQSAGLHSVSLPAALTSGSYLVSMAAGMQKMTIPVVINR